METPANTNNNNKAFDPKNIFGTTHNEKNVYILGIDPGARNFGFAFLNVETGQIDECGVFELIEKDQMPDVNKNGEKSDVMHSLAISAAKHTMYRDKYRHIFSNPRQIVMVAIEDQFVSTPLIQALTHAIIFHFTPRVFICNANAVRAHFKCTKDTADKSEGVRAATEIMTTTKSEAAGTQLKNISVKRQQHAADAILMARYFYETHNL